MLTLVQIPDSLEGQLRRSTAGIKPHLSNDRCDRQSLTTNEFGVGFKRPLARLTCTKDRLCRKRQLENISTNVVGEDDRKAAAVAAGTAITLPRSGYVLRAINAALGLWVCCLCIRRIAIGGPTLRGRSFATFLIRTSVVAAGHLGGGIHDDYVHLTVFVLGSFLTVDHHAPHTTTDGDALSTSACTAAHEGFGGIVNLQVL